MTATATGPPPDDPKRAVWLAHLGYADGDTVTLRGDNGTATTQDVWDVKCGLELLAEHYRGLFRRVGIDAAQNDRPIDGVKRLTDPEYGALTDPETGNWLPGRREIVNAFLNVEGTAVTFASQPLQPRVG